MKKLINFRPLLIMGIFLIAGIIFSYLFIFSNLLLALGIIFVFFILLSMFIVFGIKNKTLKSNIIFSLVFVLSFLLGFTVCNVKLNGFKSADLNGHTLTVSGKITEIEEVSNGQKATVSNVVLSGYKNGGIEYKVLLYSFGESELDIGDTVNFTTSLKDIGLINDTRFSATYIARNIKYTASVNYSEITVGEKSLTVFEKVNLFIRDTLIKGLGNEYGIAYGLLTGNSENMEQDTLTNFRYAGVAHIFAVSGLHIGFLAVAFNFLLEKLKTNRYLKTVLVMVVLFFYSGVCGFSASSIRASIMCSVSLLSKLLLKKYDGLTSISVSAIIILIISPIELFCVGFQLSFAVVLGLLTCARSISGVFKFLPKKISQSLGAVITAQLFSIPITLINFGYLSLISVLANMLFLPVVGTLFVGLLVFTLLGGIFSVPQITLFVFRYILYAISLIINIIDFKAFIIGGISLGFFVFVYYLILFIVSGIINISKIAKIITCVSLSLVLSFGVVFYNVKEYKSTKVIVSGNENLCATVLEKEDEVAVIVSSYIKNKSAYSLNNVLTKEGIEKIDLLILPKTETYYDVQNFITKVETFTNVIKVVYFGEEDEATNAVIEKSFKNIEIRNVEISEAFIHNGIEYKPVDNGYGVEFIVNNKSSVILSKNEKTAVELNENDYNYLIAVSGEERINSGISVQNKITYMHSGECKDAYTEGYIKFAL